MRTALVCGAGGFIGAHLVKRLKSDGFWVRGVDLVHPTFCQTHADEFLLGDLRDQAFVRSVVDRRYDEVYQLAADMGGAGYLFTGDKDADIMHNSAMINLNVLESCRQQDVTNVFYSSSACVYPVYNQRDANNPNCAEETVVPAEPDSEYGWEKLFSERLYAAYGRNYGMNNKVARFHNIFGPEGTYDGGKEKVPAAICRKVAAAKDGTEIEVWGDGHQTRSFLYIEECVEATLRLMRSDFNGPVNIGSEEMISINDLARMAISISGKELELKHVDGPTGVRGRNSHNDLIAERLGWQPVQPLLVGMKTTYDWIESQVMSKSSAV